MDNEFWYLLYFFFSSRRRHTRFDCDWSSDVCSSDLFIDHLAFGVCDVSIASDRTELRFGPEVGYRPIHGVRQQLLIGQTATDDVARTPVQYFPERLGRAGIRLRNQLYSGIVVTAKNFKRSIR